MEVNVVMCNMKRYGKFGKKQTLYCNTSVIKINQQWIRCHKGSS